VTVSGNQIEQESEAWTVGQAGEDKPSSPTCSLRPTSFEVFFEGLFTDLVHFARVRLNDKQGAEDVASEAMTLMYLRWETLGQWQAEDGGRLRLRSYAYSTVRNMIRDVLRRARRHELIPAMEVEQVSNDLADSTDTYMAVVEALEALSSFPHQQRIALAMDMVGYNTADIARVLKVEGSTARTHLNLARRRLKEQCGYNQAVSPHTSRTM
jgi:RNA polymerase sigma factor (sigma-70 family)